VGLCAGSGAAGNEQKLFVILLILVKQGNTMADMDKTVKMTVTIPKGLLEQLKAEAKAEDRNLSNMVCVLIRKSINK
jgi:hypothetical protein